MLDHQDPERLPVFDAEDFLPPIAGWMSGGGWTLSGGFVIAVAIAAITPYNNTVRVTAAVRPAGEVRIVQASAPGVVERLNTKVNDLVQQGDVLVVLEDNRLQTQKSQLQGNIRQTQVQLSQIQSQLSFLDNQTAAEASQAGRAIASAQADADRIQQELRERTDIAAAELREAESSYRIALAQRESVREALRAGAISQNQFDDKEQALQAARGRLEKARAAASPSGAPVIAAAEQIAREQARGEAAIATLNRERQTLLQRQAELQAQINRDQKELQQVELELKKTQIRAPVTGTILELNIRNPGQSVNSDSTIARISPQDAPLVVKAKVPPQDIGKIRQNQPVSMRVSAYPYPNYGTLNGKVTEIASDITPPPPGSPEPPFFTVTIQPETTYLKNDPRNALAVGMEISADIVTREETILSFILRQTRLLVDF